MCIAWGPDLTLIYNDGYADVLGPQHPAALGMSFRTVCPEAWDELQPILATASSREDATGNWLSGLSLQDGAGGPAGYTTAITPIYDDQRSLNGIFCSCRRNPGEPPPASAAPVNGSAQRARMQSDFVAALRGPDLIFEWVNSQYMELTGACDVVGRSFCAVHPHLGPIGFIETLEQVFRTGEGVSLEWAVVSSAGPDGEDRSKRLLDFAYQPLLDATGTVTGILIHGREVPADVPEGKRQELDRYARGAIDALAEHIAVIDSAGTIVAVNKAWHQFAEENGAAEAVCEGANYLEACDWAQMNGDPDATQAIDLIHEVSSGQRDSASFEYPCHSPTEERWFSMRISRFGGNGPVYLVVAHENITQRRQSEARSRHLARHDPLTDCANRAELADRASFELARAEQSGQGLAFIMVDIRGFKELNSIYGDAVGDSVLQWVAGHLRSLSGPSGLVARFGSDEFVVLLTQLSNAPIEAATFVRHLLRRLSAPHVVSGRSVSVTVRIGIGLCPTHGHTYDDLLRSAELALIDAQQREGLSARFYRPHLGIAARQRQAMVADLRAALNSDQFELVYQPQVDTRTGVTVGAEALIRWHHPVKGLLHPGSFVQVAEDSGLIIQLGKWALRAACLEGRNWQDTLKLRVSVNISPLQFRQPDFTKVVARILRETGFDAVNLELEITESMLMSPSPATIGQLRSLKAMGVSLAMDDFGTGYSNLSYLKKFPLDRLKIDQSFVREVTATAADGAIVSAMITMGHSLGMEIIAEGVETLEQARFLAKQGCDLSQGYYHGRPMSPVEFIRHCEADALATISDETIAGWARSNSSRVLSGARWAEILEVDCMIDDYPETVVAAAMQPVEDLDVPPALRASIERQSQALLGLASSLLQGGLDEQHVRSVVDQACASYREELIAAILALREQDGA